MNLDTHSYFLIILGGFGFVWGFRKGINSKKEIGDFEYLGFSAFWGVMVLAVYQWVYRNNLEKFNEILKNPYIAGAVFFLVSAVSGCVIGLFFSWIRSLVKGK